MIDCGWCDDGTCNWVVTETAEGTDYTAQEAYLPQEIVDLVDSGSTPLTEVCEECHGTGELFENEDGTFDVTNAIFAYETQEMDMRTVIQLFSELIKSGTCWKLQGSYGRMAARLIEAELIDSEGHILWDNVNEGMEA